MVDEGLTAIVGAYLAWAQCGIVVCYCLPLMNNLKVKEPGCRFCYASSC